MLMPKKVKFRKQQRGRRAGAAKGGAHIAFGDFALQALEPLQIGPAGSSSRYTFALGVGSGSVDTGVLSCQGFYVYAAHRFFRIRFVIDTPVRGAHSLFLA